jgi:hypothetical protein
MIVDIAIIGGGAAGFFAAITAAELAGTRQMKIVILEKAHVPLGKVLISGGGRCNVTHACFDPAQLVTYYPRGAGALRGAFSRFQPADIIEWFENHGVPLKTEADGRVFPRSDSSRSISNCLLEAANSAGVELRLNTAVEALEVNPNEVDTPKFRLLTKLTGRIGDQESASDIFANRVLLATGGDRNSLALAACLGHTIEDPVPSLFSFKLADPRLEGLAGVSVDPVNLTLEDLAPDQHRRQAPLSQAGPALVTHWGLSGPAALRLSAWGARWLYERKYHASLFINWVHPLTIDQVMTRLFDIKNKPGMGPQKVAASHAFPQIPNRLWQRLTIAAGVSEDANWANLSRESMHSLASQLTQAHFTVTGKGPFKEEFVTCGGVRLDEVNFKTMESRLVPGLHFAGEILDIDGLTGGFNFQNAWTTGWLAGRSLTSP